MTQRSKQPQPAMEPKAASQGEGQGNVVELPNKRGKGSFLASLDDETGEKLTNKAQLLTETANILKEAHKLYEGESKEADKAAEKAASAIQRLYQGMTANVISMAEVSDLLGREFGFRKRKDTATGKMVDGKTPDGNGKFIRDRLTRLVNAAEHATGGDGGNYFKDVSADDVRPIIERLDKGEIGPWTAYDDLSELVKQHRPDRAPSVFDAVKVAAWVDELLTSPEKSAKAFIADRSLALAYLRLSRAIDLVDDEATKLAAA